MTDNPTLTIYKASAGSGKTFTLAVEYIKLLMLNPRAYESVLAVTFTNKATEEMKMRILSQLYGLSRRLPDSKSYMNVLVEELGMSEDMIVERSKAALQLMLHNYHYFRVQTIDAFFQGVLRNLARELQLNANLRVGLNNVQVVEQAVDDMVDSLADDRKLLDVMLRYMKNNIDDDRGWNIIGKVKAFGKNIFSEYYKRNRKKMDAVFADKDFFEKYRSELCKLRDCLPTKYIEIGNQVMKIIDEAGYCVDDFSNKSRGIMSYFLKLQKGDFYLADIYNATAQAATESADKWVTKSAAHRDEIITLVESQLMPILNGTERDRASDALKYNTIVKTLAHLNDLRLLRRIEESAKQMNDAAQRFMLSDTQMLLNEFIKDGDSPFIFEKIGTRLEHVMIDEFQDTSTVQWNNFRTLLEECMGQGQSNIIVGDVKQSIYRFRSGDWRLLNDIDKQFAASQLDFQPRKTNWRSERNVILFNNAFFSLAAKHEINQIRSFSMKEAGDLERAYADVAQEIPAHKTEHRGLVHIELLPKDQLDSMAERTLQTILDLLDAGIEQKDIAILVRGGKEITELANFIEEESEGRVRIVSAEAFRLDASLAVNIIVNAMKYLAHPKDELALATLRKNCGLNSDVPLPIEFTDHSDELLALTLHDLAERIVRIFGIDAMEGESAYVSTFFDHLQSFTTEMAPVLEDFLHAWDDDLCSKNITTAECDGVRIMTIHKSKGLEFDHVILPYCNWKSEGHTETLWVEPKEMPFSQLPLVPVDYKSVTSLQGTYYEAEGTHEHIQIIVDNLNLLYVAMTRAGRSLFIIGERPGYDKNGNMKLEVDNRSILLYKVIADLPDTIDDEAVHINGMNAIDNVLEVTYGSLLTDKSSEKKHTDNVFEMMPEAVLVPLQSFEPRAEYRQSNESRRFADDTTDETDRQRYIRMGTVMHQLFSTIHTLYDVEPVLRRMEFDGTLYDEGMTREHLLAELRRKFANSQVKDWFNNRWKVYNECSIVTRDGEQRPDRVITDGQETIVIDFKFGHEHREHQEQVLRYMSLLTSMGMPKVKGYLWYVTQDKVLQVTSDFNS